MKNFRTKVFKQAYELMRATGKAFGRMPVKSMGVVPSH